MKKIVDKKSAETHRTSNGLVVGWAPDAKVARPLTEKEWANATPVSLEEAGMTPAWQQAMNELISIKLRGRPRKPNKKRDIKLRIDPDVLDAFKATGKGWQTQMNAVLKAYAERTLRP